MIRTIIFDLGKVLVPFDFARGYAGMAPFCPYSPEDMRARLSATDLVHRFESGRVEPEDFVLELSRILDLRVAYEQFCDIWSSIFLPHTLVPESWIASLHAQYRLLLLSNTNAIHFKMIRDTYPIIGHFDDFILSYEVKAMKPSALIYQQAIRKAECAPSECFYTDDIREYVDAARDAGIDAVQFQSAEQLKRELQDRGIQVE